VPSALLAGGLFFLVGGIGSARLVMEKIKNQIVRYQVSDRPQHYSNDSDLP
jgi:hypothetical protein